MPACFAIELYNRADDPTLSNILVSTNAISTAEHIYRYDFPSIDTYPTGDFSDTDSISEIANETLALKEIISNFMEGSKITGGLSVDILTTTGNVDISGGLSVNTITTTGNVDVGGLFLAPNQVSFKAEPATSNGSINTSIVLPFDRVIYNIGNAYDNLTYKFIAPVSGVYFFYSHFFSSGNNKYTADFLLDDGTGDTLLYRIERSTTRIGGTTNIPASFTTQLNSGDQVYIKRTDGVINMPQYPFSQFGGHLLA